MKPEFGIVHEREDGEFTVLSIDRTQAKYQGHPWLELSSFYKRKFENLLVISNPKKRLKVVYG